MKSFTKYEGATISISKQAVNQLC